jgi:chromosome partitioning protein
MRTIAVMSQKGGAGKTTVSVHLAVAAQQDGYRAAVIDLDPQATARKWGDKRVAEPEVIGDHAERLPHLIDLARANGADLLIIDTAPNADRASLTAARAADMILIPCRPAAFDLEAIEATTDLASIAKKPAWVLLNASPIRSAITDEAAKSLEVKGTKVCPHVLHVRVAYSHSVIDGRTALEFEPDGKAADEVRAVFRWTRGQVGLPTRQRAAA